MEERITCTCKILKCNCMRLKRKKKDTFHAKVIEDFLFETQDWFKGIQNFQMCLSFPTMQKDLFQIYPLIKEYRNTKTKIEQRTSITRKLKW